jgi:hypothetical protein
MPPIKTAPKPDDPSLEKYYYTCQVRGCGAVINEAFPIGLKTPAPKYCKNCQNAETRHEVEAAHDARVAG